MKILPVFVIVFLFGCRSNQSPSKRPADPVQLYLTTDISINSSLLTWQNCVQQIHDKVLDGSLDLYTDSTLITRFPSGDRRTCLAYEVKDMQTGATDLIPVENVLLKGVPGGFLLYQVNPFTSQEQKFGYVSVSDCITVMDPEEAAFIWLLKNIQSFPEAGSPLTESYMYTEGLLLFDAVQKQIAGLVETGKLQGYDEMGEPMQNTVRLERGLQLEDSLHADGTISTHWVKIPEYDLWKGFMAYGNWNANTVIWRHFGLLYHPDSKYAGYDPGKITWFAFSPEELKEEQMMLARYVQTLAKYAMLYSADPEHYRCNYYTVNSIRIENKRY